MTMDRDFKGIRIPKEIRLSKDLSIQEKVLLVEIQSLDKDDGCFASNNYFADFFGLSPKYISRLINGLNDKGKISVMITPNNGNRRTLHILEGGIPQKVDTYPTKGGEGIPQKVDSNNTYNNTNNIVYTKPTIKNILTDTSLEELRGFDLLEEFVDYRSETDKKGNERRTKEKTWNLDLRLKKRKKNKDTNFGRIKEVNYDILENFDKGCRTNIDGVKEFYKKKYGNGWQNKYSLKRKERLHSPFITKGD